MSGFVSPAGHAEPAGATAVGTCRVFQKDCEMKTDYKTKSQAGAIKFRLGIQFESDDFGCIKMICQNYDYTEVYKFERNNRRWRQCPGRFCGSAYIGSLVFEYDENSVSNSDCYFMTEVISAFGYLIDASEEAIREGVRKKIEYKQQLAMPKRNHLTVIESDEEFDKYYVYLMRHANGLTKIGFSKNPQARERTLQAEDPRLHMIFYTDGTKEMENRLHSIFQPARVRGEWFKLQEHHVDWIVFLLGNRTETKADGPA